MGPSITEYAFQGAKISLALLREASQAVPMPYAQISVAAACTLINIADQIRSNKEQRNALNARVFSLMLVIVTTLKGKSKKDIPPGLKTDVEQVTSDLTEITAILRSLSAQNLIRQLLFKDDNATALLMCCGQLDTAIRKFDVARKIDDAVRLHEIAASVQRVQLEVQATHASIKAQKPSSGSTARIPPKPLLFHGRDQLVEDIALRISTVECPRIAILGPGGMGKTSVALAVMSHPAIIQKFANNRFWVPGVEATSLSLFLDLLTTSFQITPATNDRLRDIVAELEASSDPRILLLDNFETPWDLHGCRSKVEDVLCTLAALPHVALLVTMRSNFPPSEGINWERLEWSSLPALDEHAARQVYITIHPAAESDPALDALLTALGYMPLAITLMAKLGRSTADMPANLLKAWNDANIGTDLLGGGLDSRSNVNISVELSTNSNHMKANPDAITLLAILSMLPGGATRDFLPQLAPSISNPSGALATLTQLSLAELRNDNTSILVQPVVRSYMLRRHPLKPAILQDVCNAFCQFVLARKSEPGDSDFDEHVRDFANEESNIHAVLMEAARSGHTEDTLDAMISFSWHQYYTRPRADIIERMVEVVRGTNDNQRLAEGLYCQGHIYHVLNRFDHALASLKEAREIFKTRGDRNPAAYCLLRLGEFYRWQGLVDDSRTATEEAQQEFRSLGNARGVADSLMQSGRLSWEIGRTAEARTTLEQARQEFVDLGHPLDAAQCLYYLSEVHLTEGSFDAALQSVGATREEFLRLANSTGASLCLTRLGLIHIAHARYAEALDTFQQALREFRQMDALLRIAQCLQGLGLVYQQQSQYSDAVEKYEESRQHFQRIRNFQGKFGAAECMEGLGDTYYLQSRHGEATAALEQAAQEYLAIDWNDWRSRCLQLAEQIRQSVQTSEGENSVGLTGTLFGFIVFDRRRRDEGERGHDEGQGERAGEAEERPRDSDSRVEGNGNGEGV